MARIGTVGYLNARPLSDKVDIDRHTLLLAHPAEVARMLRDGEVDVALVPVAAALTDGDFRVVPGVAIGAEGPVHSVLLAAETPPEQWTSVRLDGVSRTSVVLARLLLTRGPLAARVQGDLEIVDVPPNAGVAGAGGTVASLVIGDAALALDDRWAIRVDLAEQWQAWTGLPFVFAVWAGRPDLDPEVVSHLAKAGKAGVAGIPRKYACEDLRYLTENLRYPLDDAALMGLRRFAALAHADGLVAREDLELYGPPVERLAREPVADLLEAVIGGRRLTTDEARRLHRHATFADLAAAAHEVRLERHAADQVGYWVEEAPEVAPLEGIRPVVVGLGRDLVAELVALREEQDRTGAIAGVRVWAADVAGPYGESENTAVDHQRVVALARLVLDNVDHCYASVATEGLGMAQASLRCGNDHLGGVAPDQVDAVERHLREAGFAPRRDEAPAALRLQA